MVLVENSLFRSEEMTLIQLYIPYEIAQATVAELGEAGCVEFRDLNPEVNAFQRAFVNEIRRLDDMDRKLRFLRTQCTRSEIPIRPLPAQASTYARTRSQQEIDELGQILNEYERKIQQMNNSQETLNKRYLELTELRHVLRETAVFFEEAEHRVDDIVGGAPRPAGYGRVEGDGASPLLLDKDPQSDVEQGTHHDDGPARSMNLGFVAGVVPRLRMSSFERILWRALRGNLYMNYAEFDEPIRDPTTDEVVHKNIFIIFAHGREILSKIRKLSESMGATLYPVDENSDKRREDALEVIARIEDLNNVLFNTTSTRRAELQKVAENLEIWETIAIKEKSIYHTMNQFNYDVNRKCLIAEGWCPRKDLPGIQFSLRNVTERTASTIPPLLSELHTSKAPPTYHRTNKFTSGFQAIIDSYGVARYQEVNPGLFTLITFPFLFAVMFGDLGHAIIMTMFAAWMCWDEKALGKKAWGEIWTMFFSGRYIILLMGIFSLYTGLIYNDIFSRALEIFGGSAFEFDTAGYAGKKRHVGAYTRDYPYPFGVDPVWHTAENALIFTNSYKMKMSVIFGLIHMSFGIILQVFNHRHFHNELAIWTEFLPQLIFMESIFGYLVLMIMYKWLVVWTTNPPSLLNMLIKMFLSPGSVDPSEQLYSGQAFVQTVLVLVAVICIPWMLLAKPLILRKRNKRLAGFTNLSTEHMPIPGTPGHSPDYHSDGDMLGPHDDGEGGAGSSSTAAAGKKPEEMSHEAHFDFGEIMIHQMIHSIEFCLGCISNTASYLRLWALSLAHAQLSEVLWDMILVKVAFGMDGAMGMVGVFCGFTVWFVLTIGILLLMEGLSAFLHALRLHWVEFDGKFYEGSGQKFVPYSFARILAGDEAI